MHQTLTRILTERKDLNNTGVTFIAGRDHEKFLSYAELYDSALEALLILQRKGLKPGDELVFQIDDNQVFIVVFWACVLGGIIPVPLSIGQHEDHRQKLFNIWPVLNNPHLVIASADLDKLSTFARQKKQGFVYTTIAERIMRVEDIVSYHEGRGEVFLAGENDIAFIQFSSGSTGNPKGVILTHKNLITNIKAIHEASGYSPHDSMISWMPLTHDMGLIGFHLSPLFSGLHHYLIPTSAFVRNPALWLDKASEHHVTILSSPNFGYKYTLKHCDTSGYRDWDLSHVRIIYNGAEPVSRRLCHDFQRAFAAFGLKGNAMCPVYGLAEASLAVSISGIADAVISVDLDRTSLNLGNRIKQSGSEGNTVSFVNVGKAVPYCSIRIADSDDAVVGDDIIGHVQIKGDNVTSGYYNNEQDTAKAFAGGGWLRTGDLGFTRNNALYITGRYKDIIFVNGQNYYPHDIERLAEEIEGIELNKIAVAAFFDERKEKEETLAFIFHRGTIETFVPLAEAVKALISSKAGLELTGVIPVKDIPRTTSGKLQRFKLIEQYRKGAFDEVAVALDQCIGKQSSVITHPENDVEQKLAVIWRKVLKHDTIDVNQDLFAIGGNSLKAAEISMMVTKEFQVHLPPERLYEKPTIRQLAREVGSLAQRVYTAIPVAGKREYYPATSAQRRLYYIWAVDPASTGYNIPVAFRTRDAIDRGKLEETIMRLIYRHDSLRMSFRMASAPEFRVHDQVSFKLEYGECHENEINGSLKQLIRPFDLAHAPLFRIHLLKVRDEYVLFMDFHHIIADGISISNLAHELLDGYAGHELQALPARYTDFACWEAQGATNESILVDKAYWLNQLQGAPPVLDLPCDFPRPATFSFDGEKTEFVLDTKTTAWLKRMAQEQQCTLHVLMFTIYNVLLTKYTGQEELIVGMPVSGRVHPDLLQVQGMFVNNLAIRSTIQGDEPFVTLLKKEKNLISEAVNHQQYPFEDLHQATGIRRDMSRNPLFDTMLIYQNMEFSETKRATPPLVRHFIDPCFSKFDISMEIFPDEGSIKYYIEYSTRLFKKATISRFAKHFETLINNIISSPFSKISDLSVLSKQEYDEHVVKFNATTGSRTEDRTIHALFEEQARQKPGCIAIQCGGVEITYRVLDQRVNRIANFLKKNGVEPGQITGVLIERSPELLISILGILKAGGCYVPIDVELPDARIKYILENSQCRTIMTSAAYQQRLQKLQAGDQATVLIVEDIEKQNGDKESTISPPNVNNPNDPAYVIYTSGTSGEPKGVMIEHGSLTNYITWAAERYVEDNAGSFAFFTSISFDLTVTSIFVPLVTGNKVIIYPEDPQQLLIDRIIADNKVEVIKLTPSHLKIVRDIKHVMPAECRLRTLIVGGEALESHLAHDVYNQFKGTVKIYNEYGPTEATVGCMIHKFDPHDPGGSVPIGVPADNVQVYVLDKFLKPVPTGVSGELYVSGKGVASGYLFNDELTAQKFIPDPFTGGQKMYKTGDLARRLATGTLEYVGRSDQQVKINGYRIELSEIERCLITHRDVTAALVVLRENNGLRNLYAYYLSQEVIGESELRRYLALRLPHYMLPVRFVRIEKLPLTKNGKTDYPALPFPEVPAKNIDPLPHTAIEASLLETWKEIFRDTPLSIRDNFFELGGDSIKAVRIASRLFEKGIFLHVKDILTYHTIEAIALHVKATPAANKYEQNIATGEKGLCPIESWFFGQDFKNPNYYNQSLLLTVNRSVDDGLLEAAFKTLIRHHDSLRINYNPLTGKLFYNNRHLETGFRLARITDAEGSTADLPGICSPLKNCFDITTGLLVKAAIIEQGNDSRLLFITAHHLVMDGVSWRILLEDLYALYNALEKKEAASLPQKTAMLPDWEKALTGYSETGNSKTQEAYWREVEQHQFAIPQDLETDDWRVANQEHVTGTLARESTEILLKKTYRACKADVSVVLHTALVLALKTWTGQDVFCIEQENHGRHLEAVDTSRTLGWFTALYPVRLKLTPGLSTGDQIKSVKAQLEEVPDHGIGYGICKYLTGNHNGKPESLVPIRFNYLGQFGQEFNNDLFSFNGAPHGSDIDPENKITARLEFRLMIINDKLSLEIHYNQKAHLAATMIWLRDLFFDRLQSIFDYIESGSGLHLTPSDFALDLEQKELDMLFQ